MFLQIYIFVWGLFNNFFVFFQLFYQLNFQIWSPGALQKINIYNVCFFVSVHAFVGLELFATTLADKHMSTVLPNLVLVKRWQRLESLVTDITGSLSPSFALVFCVPRCSHLATSWFPTNLPLTPAGPVASIWVLLFMCSLKLNLILKVMYKVAQLIHLPAINLDSLLHGPPTCGLDLLKSHSGCTGPGSRAGWRGAGDLVP